MCWLLNERFFIMFSHAGLLFWLPLQGVTPKNTPSLSAALLTYYTWGLILLWNLIVFSFFKYSLMVKFHEFWQFCLCLFNFTMKVEETFCDPLGKHVKQVLSTHRSRCTVLQAPLYSGVRKKGCCLCVGVKATQKWDLKMYSDAG